MSKTVEEFLKDELKDNKKLKENKDIWLRKLETLYSEHFNNDEFLELLITDVCKSLYKFHDENRFRTSSTPEIYTKKASELFLLLYFYLREEDNTILINCINKWEKSYERSKMNKTRRNN